MDLGIIGERTFVNNASFGAYAEVVKSPAYRDDKRGTTLQMLPDLLNGHHGARLAAQAAGTRIEGPQALLISNNPYEMTDIAGLGRRARIDDGKLGVVAVRVDSARQAIGLLRRGHGRGLTVLTADEVTVDADVPQIPVGIDGETVLLPAPVRCAIRPRALRVVVPRHRPGVPPPKPPLDWPRLRELSSFRPQPSSHDEDRSASAIRLRLYRHRRQMAVGQLRLDQVLPVHQLVHRGHRGDLAVGQQPGSGDRLGGRSSCWPIPRTGI